MPHVLVLASRRLRLPTTRHFSRRAFRVWTRTDMSAPANAFEAPPKVELTKDQARGTSSVPLVANARTKLSPATSSRVGQTRL